MSSVYFALVSLAIVFVIFWSVRSDQLPPEAQWGPFAMRRPRGAAKENPSGSAPRHTR
jgi:hypothetical protein